MIAAVVPAAGLSRRMGHPKLLIEFNGRKLLAAVVEELRQGGIDLVVTVVPPATEPEGPALALEATNAGARVVAPEIRPAEMRESVEIGLEEVARLSETEPELLLLAPADSPGISADLVQTLIRLQRETPRSVVLPKLDKSRGHPVVMPWRTALRIRELPPDVGVNSLIAAEREAGRYGEHRILDATPHEDLDTPEDLARWQELLKSKSMEAASEKLHDVTIRLFALARERAGASEITVSISDGDTVARLKERIALAHPSLADLLPNVMVAVDSEYAANETVIPPNAQVALIPPVSGGSEVEAELLGKYR